MNYKNLHSSLHSHPYRQSLIPCPWTLGLVLKLVWANGMGQKRQCASSKTKPEETLDVSCCPLVTLSLSREALSLYTCYPAAQAANKRRQSRCSSANPQTYSEKQECAAQHNKSYTGRALAVPCPVNQSYILDSICLLGIKGRDIRPIISCQIF